MNAKDVYVVAAGTVTGASITTSGTSARVAIPNAADLANGIEAAVA